jgi:hypothetical protein
MIVSLIVEPVGNVVVCKRSNRSPVVMSMIV